MFVNKIRRREGNGSRAGCRAAVVTHESEAKPRAPRESQQGNTPLVTNGVSVLAGDLSSHYCRGLVSLLGYYVCVEQFLGAGLVYSPSLKGQKTSPLGLKPTEVPSTWFYSLENCVCLGLGEGNGFSAFARNEPRDTELDLIHPKEKLRIQLFIHRAAPWCWEIKPCLSVSLCRKENSEEKGKSTLNGGNTTLRCIYLPRASPTGIGSSAPAGGSHKAPWAQHGDKANQFRLEFSLGLGRCPSWAE